MQLFLSIFSILLIAAVFFSLVRNDYWIFRILEYPRLQKLVLVLLTGAAWAIVGIDTTFHMVLVGLLLVSAFYLAYKIHPYSILGKREMLTVAGGRRESEIVIFSANVLQENTNYDRMLQQIRSSDPDLVYLLETNRAWAEAMAELKKDYPYQLLEPLENTYGLLFYSKLPISDASINYLVKDDIPSIEAKVSLPSGQQVQLWGLHPEPPVPQESLYATAKDKELMKIAFKARECKLPCIVFGDLNDVAWSHTTELFRKTSGLLDPRRGRGAYSTFSAHHWLIRYPLDYIFCSTHFGLVRMFRFPPNGSDHFATLSHLSFQEELARKQEEPRSDSAELSEAKEMATQTVDPKGDGK